MRYLKNHFLLFLLFCCSISAFPQTGAIRINQLGYYTVANKFAIVVYTKANSFEIINVKDNSVAFSGKMSSEMFWEDSGDSIKKCDFSKLTRIGIYKVRIPGFGESYPFEISNSVLRKVAYASLKSFYYQRCSYKLIQPYAGLWAREEGHPDTQCILHPSTGESGKIASPGGWYDAGDYGKYVTNAGISVATLLSFHENFKAFFPDGSIHIPESGNAKNDLLDEVKFELDWLKTMQDKDGGVFFKLTTLRFSKFVLPEADKADRYVIGKATASALDFAATMAMAGRIYQEYDAAYAADCIIRAEKAWVWAKMNPDNYFIKNPSDVNTGEYSDNNVSDEFIWAVAELYITTRKDEYKNYLIEKSNSLKYQSAPGYDRVQSLASLSLATQANGLPKTILADIKQSIISTSDNWLKQIEECPDRIPKYTFNWGANAEIANRGIGLLYAYMLTKDFKYMKGAAECADYLLGKNATGYSFVTSFGYKTPINIHHRPSASDGVIQPVPGFLAGGPNPKQEDERFYSFVQPAKCYIDSTKAFSANEVAINWNSPMTALFAGIDAALGNGAPIDFKVPTEVNNPPTVTISFPGYDAKISSNQPLTVKGTATDADGIAKVELYIDAHFAGLSTNGDFDFKMKPLSSGIHTVTILAYNSKGITTENTNKFSYCP